MTEALPTSLSVLSAAFRHLRRHPGLVFGIATLTALFSALGPLLQLRFALGNDLVVELALRAVSLIPLELYFVPRFLAMLDAETAGRPENAPDQWRDRFEERWLKAFGARVLLYLICGVGLMFFLVPGLVAMAVFGWAPLRVLLRGDSLPRAFRASTELMARTWPVVLRAALGVLALYFLVVLALSLGLGRVYPEPTPWQRLTSPLIWGLQALSGLLELFLSATFLALYQAVEPQLQDSSSR